VGVAFAASAALATAQNGASNSGKGDPAAVLIPYKEVVIPDSMKGRDVAFKKAVKLDRAEALPSAEAGPEIDPDEVHVPAGPVADKLVEFCDELIERDALERNPLCQVVELMDEGAIKPGVYQEQQIENRFEKLEATQEVTK